LTPEARARQGIDALLVAAGWAIEHVTLVRVIGKVDRHFSTIREVEAEVPVNLQGANGLSTQRFRKRCTC
jgi:hypothetical protein